MFRRRARDGNYEFWGNEVFYGETPPQSAQIPHFLKNKPNAVKLKITDATGREIRAIAVPAAAVKAGVNSACWDLRVQPIPAPDLAGARGGRGTGGAPGAGGTPTSDPFRFGCSTPAGGGGAVRWFPRPGLQPSR